MNASTSIARARAAGASWAATSWPERQRVLSRLAKVFASRQDDLVESIVRDTSKPALDALGGDVLVTLEHMRYYKRHARSILRPQNIAGDWLLFRSTRFRQTYEPHGVVLVFGPANYPLQLSMVPAITALYAGNAVIVKASDRAPHLAETLRDVIEEAQLPVNLVQVISDPPERAGDYIEARPDFICFTGSTTHGTLIAERAAKLLIPTLLELGGKDAAIVFNDCDIERTVEGVLYGAFSNSGQVCVGTKRLYIERALFNPFLMRLNNRIKQLRVGQANEPERDITPIPAGPHLAQLSSLIDDALRRGSQVLNETRDLTGATPILLGGVSPDANLQVEECFGPVICVESFDEEHEAIRFANNSRYALGASVWTRDLRKAERVATRLTAANVSVNDVIRNIANPAASFGGNGASGYGRYHGAAGLIALSRTKTTMTNSSRSKSERNWFPLTTKAYQQLRKLIRFRHNALIPLLYGITLFWPASLRLYAQPAAGHLHLRVSLSSKAQGQLAYLIFGDPKGFPNDNTKAIRHGFLPYGTPMTDIDLGELPRGRYAVSVYLDENNNKKLDTGWFGIPKEPVGTSQNPRSRMGPPRFDESSFEMTTNDLTLDINMVELR